MPALVIEIADDKPALSGLGDSRRGCDGVVPRPFAGSDHVGRGFGTGSLDEIVIDEDGEGRGRKRIGVKRTVLRPAFRGAGTDLLKIISRRSLQCVRQRVERPGLDEIISRRLENPGHVRCVAARDLCGECSRVGIERQGLISHADIGMILLETGCDLVEELEMRLVGAPDRHAQINRILRNRSARKRKRADQGKRTGRGFQFKMIVHSRSSSKDGFDQTANRRPNRPRYQASVFRCPDGSAASGRLPGGHRLPAPDAA